MKKRERTRRKWKSLVRQRLTVKKKRRSPPSGKEGRSTQGDEQGGKKQNLVLSVPSGKKRRRKMGKRKGSHQDIVGISVIYHHARDH